MALILRHCILSRKKLLAQKFLLFHHNVSSHTYVNNNIKTLGSILHTKHFSTENDKEHIYKGALTNRIRNLKIFSYTTSFISICLQPVIYMKAIEDDNLTTLTIMLAFMNLTAIGSPLVVHWLTRRYVTDMYYYPKQDIYVAEVYNMFLKKKQIMFNSDETDIPETNAILKSCTIHGHPLLFAETEFTDRKHYNILMGYNDPIDFEMGPGVTNTQELSIESTHKKLIDGEKDYKQIESRGQN